MRGRQILVVAFVIAAFAGMAVVNRHLRDGLKARNAAEPVTVPALATSPEDGLELRIELVRAPRERRVRFLVEGGEATLVLHDTGRPTETGTAFGKASLQPVADRTRGAAFVASVARWLGVPAGAAGNGELKPLSCAYVRLGADGEWEANKLFLELGNRDAEVFVNISHDGKRARLVEKDEEYREDLIALLAIVLRDGPPARRTPQSDPNLASATPLIGSTALVAGADGVRAGAWLGSRYVAPKKIDGMKAALFEWTQPRAHPRQLAIVDGWVTEVVPAPETDMAVLVTVHSKDGTSYSSDDAFSLLVLDTRNSSIKRLVSSPHGRLGSPIWSPDGRLLAFPIWDPKLKRSTTQVFDLGKRQPIKSLDATPLRWDGAGLVFSQFDPDAGGTFPGHGRTYRWMPGLVSPVAIPDLDPYVSPDGRFSFSVAANAIQISGAEKHSVRFARQDDREAIELLGQGDLRWVGGHGLVIDLEEPVLLDLETRKLHLLFPDPSLDFESASPDGRTILGWDADRRLVWAQIGDGGAPPVTSASAAPAASSRAETPSR
jgi:hypothetical protein